MVIEFKPRKKALQRYRAGYMPSAGQPLDPNKPMGVLLLNMGGPDDQDSVKPFLINLFSDPDILRLPPIIQPLLARIIVAKRGDEAKANYALMGGGSPQLATTKLQAKALTEALQTHHQLNVTTAIAMRYWHPFTNEALQTLRSAGVEQLVVTTLYPHFSYTTTGSNLNELRRQLTKMNWDVPVTVVSGYHKTDWYQAAFAQCIESGLDEGVWTCPREEVQILFSAHSLPIRHVRNTGDPYERHTIGCVEAVMNKYFPDNPWDLAYQSKVGNFPWLGPPTDGVLSYYAGKNRDNILVVPVSFVSDHIETLVELDIEYIPDAREEGIQHIHRAPVMNTRPAFIDGLAGEVASKVHARSAYKHQPMLAKV